MNSQLDPLILYNAITSLIKFGSHKEALDLTLFLTFSPNGFTFPIYKIFKQLYGKEGCKNYKTIFESLSDCNGLNYSHRTILLALFQLEGSCGHVKDFQNAIDVLESMTDFSSALTILGYLHYKGWNDEQNGRNLIPINLERAQELFEQAAFKGNSFGFWFLSEIYQKFASDSSLTSTTSSSSASTTAANSDSANSSIVGGGSGGAGAVELINFKDKYEWALSKAVELNNPIAVFDQQQTSSNKKDSKTVVTDKLFGISIKTRKQLQSSSANLLDYLC